MNHKVSGLNQKIIERSNAKVNLFLNVNQKVKGAEYHLIQSIVVFTDFADTLEISPTELSYNTIEAQGQFAKSLPKKDNSIFSAISFFQKRFNTKENFHIKINKNIPLSAGLGGGSANAAALIRALLKHYNLQLKPFEICNLAFDLGADIPSCFYSKNLIMEGIGHILTPIKLPHFHIVMINPNIPISTQESFSNLKQINFIPPTNIPTKFITIEKTIEFLSQQTNSLARFAYKKHPILNDLHRKVQNTNGNLFTSMSGSGSTIFGIYKDKKTARDATKILKKEFPNFWITYTFIIDR